MEQSSDLGSRLPAFVIYRQGRDEVGQVLVAWLHFVECPSLLACDLEILVHMADDVRNYKGHSAITEQLESTLVRCLTGSEASTSTALRTYQSYAAPLTATLIATATQSHNHANSDRNSDSIEIAFR